MGPVRVERPKDIPLDSGHCRLTSPMPLSFSHILDSAFVVGGNPAWQSCPQPAFSPAFWAVLCSEGAGWEKPGPRLEKRPIWTGVPQMRVPPGIRFPSRTQVLFAGHAPPGREFGGSGRAQFTSTLTYCQSGIEHLATRPRLAAGQPSTMGAARVSAHPESLETKCDRSIIQKTIVVCNLNSEKLKV